MLNHCCVSGINVVLSVTCTVKKTNEQEEKEIRFIAGGCRKRMLERGNWMKIAKKYKLLVIR